MIASLLKDTGLRPVIPLTENNKQPHYRSNIMQCHGFRKFFETNSFKADMNHMYIRRLMGQKQDLEDAYLKLSEEELLEGDSKHSGYIGIIDQLTIDYSQRLRRENEQLIIKASEVNQVLAEINEVKKHLGLI